MLIWLLGCLRALFWAGCGSNLPLAGTFAVRGVGRAIVVVVVDHGAALVVPLVVALAGATAPSVRTATRGTARWTSPTTSASGAARARGTDDVRVAVAVVHLAGHILDKFAGSMLMLVRFHLQDKEIKGLNASWIKHQGFGP